MKDTLPALIAKNKSPHTAGFQKPEKKTVLNLKRVVCDDPQVLGRRIANAVDAANEAAEAGRPRRIVLEIVGPGVDESVAAIERAAHHDAITLLDAFCNAF